jgi:HYR domain/Ricin-type beta-trefoil lectin domain-like/Secretion system C-terminal sorting domain
VGLGIGSCFPIGTTTVTYKATDAKGNSATCSFTVTVTKTDPCETDATPPTFANCPTNISLTTTTNCAVANWVAPTASDNCGGTPSVSLTTAPTAGLGIGSCFPIGTTTVTYKATDAKGNSTTCSFTVKVVKIISCNNVTNAGKISKTCVDGKVTLSNTESPSGGSGTLEYVWLKSTVRCPPGNHDEVVPNSNTPTLVVGSVTQTTYFVRCVRRVGCTTEDDFVESNCILVLPGDCSNGFGNNDCVKITNKKSGNTIDVYRSLTWGGTKIIQKSYDNTKSQKWTFKNLGNGYYIIISKNSGKVLDIDGTGDYCATGSHLIQDYYDGSKSQQFKLVKNADGSYKIINRRCNKVLKVHNGSSDSGASIVLGEDSDADHSKWLIDKVDCPSSSHHLTANTIFTLEANAQFNRTHLEWINNTTVQNDYFTIQKINSQSGNFEDIETINAVEGLDELQYYTSYDNNPVDGENYYRIKLVYQDGKIEYSETKVVNFKGLSDIRIFPNPSDDFVDVDLTKYKNKEVGIYLYNAFGQPVQFVNVEKVGDTPVRLDVSKLNSGNFLLRITSKGKRDVTKQLIITR